MCDTFIHIPSSTTASVIFGKNSDREPNEAQQIVCYPEKTREKNTIRTTFIEVEHPRETCEVILSKPFQMWGAEMGCNEFGVCIGNEAVFTKIQFDKKNIGLTGMDLLRLSLEISKTAEEGLNNIIYYLEKYGQDACGGYTDKNFYYHNSFIIADKNEGYVLETAGKHWVYEKVKGYRAISNGLSIEEKYDGISKNAIDFARQKNWTKNNESFNFKKAYSQWLMPKLAACEFRRTNNEQKGKSFSNFNVENAFQILRSHSGDNFLPEKGTTQSMCMHASGLFTPHQTTGSMVVELRKEKPATIWLTGTSTPCISLFKPFYFGNDVLQKNNFISPTATYDNSYWWQWEAFHRNFIHLNYQMKIIAITSERLTIENYFLEEDEQLISGSSDKTALAELSSNSLRDSEDFLDRWKSKITHSKKIGHFLYDAFWNRQNKKAGLLKNKQLKLSALILFLFSFSFSGFAKTTDKYHSFALQYDSLQVPSVNYGLGHFSIQWNSRKGILSLVNTQQPGKILWQNAAGTGFCGAAQGNMDIREKRGSFLIKDKKKSVTTIQEINSISGNDSMVSVRGYFLSGKQSVSYQLSFSLRSENQLHIRLFASDKKYDRLYLSNHCSISEHFFGLGEQPTHLDHKGNRIPVLVQEQGIGRGDMYTDKPVLDMIVHSLLGASAGNDYTSYKPVPHYISSLSNSIYLENTEYSEFDFTQKDKIQIEVFSDTLQANIIFAKKPLDAIEEYTLFSGRMQPLPNWIQQGAVIGMQGGTEKVYEVWKTLEKAGTPISAFWLQDWVGQRITRFGKQLWWNWELDDSHYPNWNKLLDSLHHKGINVMGYINPYLVELAGQKEKFKRDMYKEALTHHYLVCNKDGDPYQVNMGAFKASVTDLSDTSCVRWMKDIIRKELLGKGLSGWMADFGEALPFDITLHSGEDPASYHQKYPEAWAKLNREVIQEAGREDSIVFFSRSGFSKSPGYSTLFWQGDQLTGWGENDGLPSSVKGLLSSGLSGFSLNHSDIGGYTSIGVSGISILKRSRELLYRWMEMAAFTPVYRTHEGLGPDKNYQVYQDTATAKHFARNAKIYRAWLFYRKQLMEEAAQKGYPICRSLFLDFPNDVNTYSLSTQFMVGSELLVAPVLDQNKTTVNVYLPNGTWVNIWTNQVVNSTGQNFSVTGLSDRAAVFYKQDSAVGLQFKQNLMNEGIN